MTELIKTALATLITFCLILVLWSFATGPGGLPPSALPPLPDVIDALNVGWLRGNLYPHIAFTAKAAFAGLLIGVALGAISGAIVVLVPSLEPFVVPIVVGLQSTPKIAIAPLIIAYVGYGVESKIFTAALLAFFPVFVAAVQGLRSLDPLILDLYRAFSASRVHILLHARLPASAPYMFAGLQVAVMLSLIGTIVSEFVASTRGLGFIIKSRAQEFDVSMMFASIITLAIMGVTGTFIIQALQRKMVFWIRHP